MIFWTTWMLAIIAGAVCVGAAMESYVPAKRWLWLGCGYFSMSSGVVCSMLGVPL